MTLWDYLGFYLRRNPKLTIQGLIQDLEISYYRLMSKYAQNRRNPLKLKMPAIQAPMLPQEVIA
jgi:hypothetical protein